MVGPTQSSGIQQMSGKYMVVWRHIGDRWQLYRDMWNDDPVAPR
jgi:ketosteroid isomerase-like protein